MPGTRKKPALYQVDLIIFTHQNASSLLSDFNAAIPGSLHGIPLRTEVNSATTPYHLLPPQLPNYDKSIGL